MPQQLQRAGSGNSTSRKILGQAAKEGPGGALEKQHSGPAGSSARRLLVPPSPAPSSGGAAAGAGAGMAAGSFFDAMTAAEKGDLDQISAWVLKEFGSGAAFDAEMRIIFFKSK